MTLDEALKEIDSLRAEVAQLKALVASLQDIIQKNSRNSSKPPSSDPPSVIRPGAPKSHNKKGGQPGHKGYKRELFSPDKVDHFIPLKPLSAVSSLRQQGKNVLEWLTSAYEAHFSGSPRPSLLPL